MNTRTKEILRDGINIYNAIPDKLNCIDTVKANLKAHYDSVNAIGMGFDADKVLAGEIFLRLTKNNHGNI